MKLAYLITAYGEWSHLERLLDALNAPGVDFFLHIDAKSAVPRAVMARLEARENLTLARRRKVWWGGWSHTAAIISSMELIASSKVGYDYCVLLSGADYPVRSHAEICATLATGGEFINARPGWRPDKPESRVRRYWFDGFDRRHKTLWIRLLRIVERLNPLCKYRYPFREIYSGIVWSALSSDCVRYIVDYQRTNADFTRFFQTALVPEEMFFQTIIGNSPFAKNIRGTLTFMDWDGDGASPPYVIWEHLPRFAPGTKFLFARKFDSRSTEILNYIDKNFRS